jgi:tetratricopeptide (TPR) repeat protein/tRNA A-37 threonylcarbamoyl transferase component Bud32
MAPSMSCPGPSALQAYLNGAATADERETMREHLEACAECRAIVLALAPTPPPEMHAALSRPAHPSLEELSSGQLVGRFIVLHRLGAGGMGVVYAAYDPDLDRKVALKLIRRMHGKSPADADQLQERLMREAQAMARVAHPNVVAVHEVGRHQEQVFIAMELVDGETLAVWLARASRSPSQIVDVFLLAARGLAAAHAAGLVHRDFKPNNVMIDEAGRVRVMDFGLARPVATAMDSTPFPSPGRLDHALTASGALLGTPAYMAPEQLAREPADPRTDQFSFCVALYEALCGVRPFVGEDTDALRTAILEHKLQRPRRRVPRWLLRVVERGLASAPAQRWPSMPALVSELGRDRSRRRGRALLGGALALLAASVGLVASRHAATQPCRGAEQKLAGVWDDARRHAIATAFTATDRPYAADALRSATRILDDFAQRWVAMRTEACEATRIHGEQSEELLDLRMECLSERLSELKATTDLFVSADANIVERAVTAASGLQPLAGCADQKALRAPMRPPADPATRARVDALRVELATTRALREAGRYQEALKRASAVATDAQTIHYRPLEAEALTLAGRLKMDLSDSTPARATLVDAVAAAEAGRHEAEEVNGWTWLIWQADNEGHFAEGYDFVKHAQACLERLGGDERLAARLERTAGLLYTDDQKPHEAHEHLTRALALAEKQFGPMHPETATTLSYLANLSAAEGSFAQARVYRERALNIFESVLGPSHPKVGAALCSLGITLAQEGRWDEALQHYRKALAIELAALGENADAGATTSNIARVYDKQGRYEEALVEQQRALTIWQHALGPEHPNVVAGHLYMGQILLRMHRPDEALAYAQQALAIWRRLGPSHTVWPLTLIGDVQLARHAPADALGPLEQAYALLQSHPIAPGEEADTRFALARTLWALGREPVRARDLAMQAKRGYELTPHFYPRELAEVEAELAKHQ